MISSNTIVTDSVAADDSPAFRDGPSHLEAQPCISWMRRTVVPSVSLISMVRFWRAAFTAPLFRVSLIQLVNSLLWSSPR
ncbi:hypothetical protein SGLAM104S_09473 [Streptomyces glaucescens]